MKVPTPDNVRPYNQDQMDLFPPSVQSLICNDHLCRVVNDVVKELDLSCLYKKVSREGNPPYHPAMMLKIIFYAYDKGLFSSRKISKAVRKNLPLIFFSSMAEAGFSHKQ